MNNIEREPNNNDFTRAELIVMHRALISEHIYSCFPPVDEQSMKTIHSASRKVVNLITKYDDKQYESNE